MFELNEYRKKTRNIDPLLYIIPIIIMLFTQINYIVIETSNKKSLLKGLYLYHRNFFIDLTTSIG